MSPRVYCYGVMEGWLHQHYLMTYYLAFEPLQACTHTQRRMHIEAHSVGLYEEFDKCISLLLRLFWCADNILLYVIAVSLRFPFRGN